MKLPGPDHPITIEPGARRVRVVFNGRVVAESRRTLVLREAGYAPVYYFPREDAELSAFVRSSHASHCPYKGDASYFSLRVGDQAGENAVWTYETPYAAVMEIAGRLAFYPSRVDSIEETDN